MNHTLTPTMTRGRVWAYVGAILGGGLSIAANIAHSYVPPADAPADWQPTTGAVAFSVAWPILLFVAVEILARVIWPDGRWWTLLRFGGLLPVALIAGIVSYRHLSALLTFYGEDQLVATVGPLAIDGLMVMATSALLVIGNNTRTPTETIIATADATGSYPTYPPATTHRDNTPAIRPAHMPTPEPAIATVEFPAHLLSTAQFTSTNFGEQIGRPIRAEELAAAMSVTPAVAEQLLGRLQPPHLPARLNGHQPAGTR